MHQRRKIENSVERDERLNRDAQFRKDEIASEDAAVDRMIRRSIEQHGP